MVTSPRSSFASAESEDSSAESEVSSGKHCLSSQVPSLGGQGAGDIDEHRTGRGAAECKLKASWPDLADDGWRMILLAAHVDVGNSLCLYVVDTQLQVELTEMPVTY